MPRLRLFVGMWAILVLVVGATVVIADVLDLGQGEDQIVDAGNGPAPGGGSDGDDTDGVTDDGGVEVLRPGQHRVSGTVTAVHLEGAVLDPRSVATPLTVVADRGLGNGGELTGVTVGGQPSTIVWDGGRPFVLSAGGALVVEPATIDLVPDGLRVALGGGVHALQPGRYRLETPVAVGQAGIATPSDAVDFEAGAEARFDARGDASLVLAGGTHRMLGPGLVHLEGSLEVTGPDGPAEVTAFDVGPAAFELAFVQGADGTWRVDGLVDERGVAG